MSSDDQLQLLPEDGGLNDHAARWIGSCVDKWNHPRIEVRLISRWTSEHAWQIGWFVRLDKALDEWHPSVPQAHLSMAHYPWYRLDELPKSTRFEIAAGTAARAVKIVLAQMREFAADDEAVADSMTISDQVESQAQAWLLS